MLRDEPPADDALVVFRATAADRDRAVRNALQDAVDSAATYVVVRPDGNREILYGISVFARREGAEVADVLRRFTGSPFFLTLAAGDIRQAGFELVPTGSNLDHYDVQLLPGRIEGADPDATSGEIRGAVLRLLLAARGPHPNPAYSGERPDAEAPW